MKFITTFFIKALFFIVLSFQSCKDRIFLDDPTPKDLVVPDFRTDKTRIEPSDSVTFTSLTKNATRLHWDFGNYNFSQDSIVTIKYKMPGKYAVTLTAFDAVGDSSVVTKSFVVGERTITSATIKSISFVDSNGKPWNNDGTGPDVYFFVGKIGVSAAGYMIALNATPSMFPIKVNKFGPPYFKDQLYDFYFQEENPSKRIMQSWTINPNKQGKPDINGNGSFTLISGQYEVEINYALE